ncbi:hypothetical protein M407DRAFT_28134 [Tulasnella calospora MUT 4182]|uniref:Uncharacterized protein n=1 Tax=Tulasnella calospora MUT 4182 TaxID=1051891 RepID=A0A0C3QCM5_9AGAM|nr:hypothetical protein M407DRAFT_28134 [Tulasnella calospora MUT 4182]
MLERWADDETGDLAERVSAISLLPTSPAAAPPPTEPPRTNYSGSGPPSSAAKRGYIRVNGTPSPRAVYLRRSTAADNTFLTTIEAKRRMLVEIAAKKPPHRIKLLNTQQGTWLALKWLKTDVSIEKGDLQ